MYKRRTANQKRKNGKNKLEDKKSEGKLDEGNENAVSSKENEIDKFEDKVSDFPRGNITPKHCTPKRNTISSQNGSPVTPLSSPVLQTMFPRTFNSPEIEVTWDWGCSQISSDMLPPARTKRTKKIETSPFFLQPMNTFYTRRPIQKQLTEEENQKRLEFYKSILLPPSKDKHVESSIDSQNNNMEKEIKEDLPMTTTPKRSTSSLNDRVTKGEQTNFFDDSANEFMLECSQAIEEQLKNGEIELGSVVNIKLPTKESGYSPVVNKNNFHKHASNEKLKSNLFPENPGEKRRLSLKSPISKRLKSDRNKTPFKSKTRDDELMFSEQFTSKSGPVNNNNLDVNCNNNINNTNKFGHKMTNVTKHHVYGANKYPVQNSTSGSSAVISKSDHFGKKPEQLCNNGSKLTRGGVGVNSSGHSATLHAQNNSSTLRLDLQNTVTKLSNNITSYQSSVSNPPVNERSQNSTSYFKDSKLDNTDLNSLLDDDLDVELSRLDFDSICSTTKRQDQEKVLINTALQRTHTQPIVRPVPKVCSQQEIEAKRLAALNRLMMKKKKR